MELFETLYKRRSIRKYSDEEVSDEDIDKILHGAMSGPSACNKQPWEFYVIKNEDILKKIRLSTRYSNINGKIAIIVCGNLKNALPLHLKDYWIQDASAAIENILLAATALNLGSLWCGVYPQKENIKKVSEILNLDSKMIPLGIIYIGHPDEVKESRDQYDENKIHIIK